MRLYIRKKDLKCKLCKRKFISETGASNDLLFEFGKKAGSNSIVI